MTDQAKQKEALPYLLKKQIGFVLRKATQRHTSIFAELMMENMTPTRLAALAKLYELGPYHKIGWAGLQPWT